MSVVVMLMVIVVARRKSRNRSQNRRDEKQGQELFHAADYSRATVHERRFTVIRNHVQQRFFEVV